MRLPLKPEKALMWLITFAVCAVLIYAKFGVFSIGRPLWSASGALRLTLGTMPSRA